VSTSTGKSHERSRRTVLLGAFDTEDDSQGNTTLFAFVSERGAFHCTNRHEALAWLERAASDRAVAFEFWATNLEYDLVNLFGLDRLRELTFRFGRSQLISARWHGIEFRDTIRHVPESVRSLGDMLGLRKLKRDIRSSTYCLRDATITYRAAKWIRETYGSLGVRCRTTLASTAYHLWEEHYWGSPIRQASEEVIERGRAAYFGGRTEAFAAGDFRNISVIDASSMFPWAMTAGPMPAYWGSVRHSKAIEPTGCYRVRVTSDLPIPALPIRTRTGIHFPNGTWIGWNVGEELLHAIACGVRVRVLDGLSFGEHCRPFDRYVADLFRLKNSARGPARLLYKLLLNACYGKFSQRGARIQVTPLEQFERSGASTFGARVWNGLVIRRIEAPAPPWGNQIWAAIITARARVRLHREMLSLQESGARLYYCDTDSIMYRGGSRSYPEKAKEPGAFESRGFYQTLMIRGKKEYGLARDGQWEFHAKGVPLSERESYLRNGRASITRPVRLLESGRIGLAPNLWRSVEKRRAMGRQSRRPGSFHARIRSSDGFLVPLQADELLSEHGRRHG